MQDTQTAMRLVGYARVSTTRQAEHGHSLEQQQDRLRAYALAHGATMVAIEVDAGVSGGTHPDKREGLSRALKLVRSGEADGLVVIELSRLSRDTAHTLELADDANRNGWRLASVGEALDTGTAAGQLVLTVLSAMATFHRAQTREKVNAVHDRLGEQGKVRSRHAPFGWRVELPADLPAGPWRPGGFIESPKGSRAALVEHRAEQQQLALILELHTGGMGYRLISRQLAASGVVSVRTREPFTEGGIKGILRSAKRRAERGLPSLADPERQSIWNLHLRATSRRAS